MKRHFVFFSMLVFMSLPVGSVYADHLWPQDGKPSVQLFAGQGVHITINDLINFASETGRFDINLYFGNKLDPLDDSVANQQDPSAGPEHKFSSGDKISVTFGGMSIVYDFDNPTNVTPQPGISLSAVLHDRLYQGVDPEFASFTNALVVGGIITVELLAGDGVRLDGINFAKFDGANSQNTLGLNSTPGDVLSLDADGDGVPDSEDACLDSDLSATVVIDSCNAGVPNTLFASGCTIADLIAECAKGASNHGQFVSCVSHLTNDLKKAGTITGQQKGAIQSCAAKAHIP